MFAASSTENQQCDKVIWNSFKNGDKEAFATLYYQYFKFLIQKCFRLCSDKRLIEDCIHDLFLEIWSNKANLVTPDSVKAYLLCSTQRKVVRQIKKSRNYTHESRLNFEKIMCFSIEDQLISDQHILDKKKEISIALDSLTKRQREAICLRYYDNLSYVQISGIMSISTDSVYNLVSKALDNIQRLIQKVPRLQHDFLN
jgi:RNA polymerase sigma factor (sigma-70 family)